MSVCLWGKELSCLGGRQPEPGTAGGPELLAVQGVISSPWLQAASPQVRYGKLWRAGWGAAGGVQRCGALLAPLRQRGSGSRAREVAAQLGCHFCCG